MTFEVGTPRVLRAMNERTVLQAIDERGAISRAELSRVTGLSKPTVSLALARLHSTRLVREVGRTSGGRGATALLYDLDPRAALVLGLDVGRRWVRAAIADVTGEVVVRRSQRSRIRSGQSLKEQVIALSRAVAEDAGLETTELARVVMGTPGVLEPGEHRLRLAPSLPGWQKPGVVDVISEALGVELTVENDVNLAAIAEHAHGEGRTEDSFVFLSVGTGVGLAIMIDGRVFRGSAGLAGEIGYLPFPHTSMKGDWRQGGAFDIAVCAEALVRAARSAGMTARTAEDVVEMARAGDVDALEVIRKQAGLLAVGVAAVTAVLDPPLVVLGGGLGAGAADLLMEPLAAALRDLSPSRPRLAASALGAGAVLDGALVTALDSAKAELFSNGSGQVQSDAGAADVRIESSRRTS
jgi:predicted NBD/HSP70 family sugar kinase